jgi:hypothetical protein
MDYLSNIEFTGLHKRGFGLADLLLQYHEDFLSNMSVSKI